MTMRRTLHPQADVDRPCIPRNNGGRGMIIVEDCVIVETESLKKYVENSNERPLKTVEDEGILGDGKTKKKIPGEEKEELHGKATASTIYEENRCREEPGSLDLAKDRIVEKKKQREH